MYTYISIVYRFTVLQQHRVWSQEAPSRFMGNMLPHFPASKGAPARATLLFLSLRKKRELFHNSRFSFGAVFVFHSLAGGDPLLRSAEIPS